MARRKAKDVSKASAAPEAAATPQVETGASSSVAAEAAGEMPAVTDAPPEKTVDGGAGNSAGPAADAVETMTIAYPPPPGMPAAALQGAQLLVKAKSERGRRRAGRFFVRAETAISLSELDEIMLAALAADPELTVALRLVKPA